MAPSVEYPKKLFYKIQEVANIIGVEPYVLRYWESKFPMLSPEKDGSDQRRYRQKDIDLLLRVRHLLYEEKYTIAGAIEKLKEGSRGSRGPAKQNAKASERPPQESGKPSTELYIVDLPPNVDSATAAFDPPQDIAVSEEQLDALRRVREELGLLKRELANWRDELV